MCGTHVRTHTVFSSQLIYTLEGASSPTKAEEKLCTRTVSGLPEEHRCRCLIRDYRWVLVVVLNIKLMDSNYSARTETIIRIFLGKEHFHNCKVTGFCISFLYMSIFFCTFN